MAISLVAATRSGVLQELLHELLDDDYQVEFKVGDPDLIVDVIVDQLTRYWGTVIPTASWSIQMDVDEKVPEDEAHLLRGGETVAKIKVE